MRAIVLIIFQTRHSVLEIVTPARVARLVTLSLLFLMVENYKLKANLYAF